jgi:lipopolysaccharide/colanic/teichoic acid biosynthesis glycosyltransferase
MKMTAIHNEIKSSTKPSDFLRFALSNKLTSRIVIDELTNDSAIDGGTASTILSSRHWLDRQISISGKLSCYDDRIPIQNISGGSGEGWLDICDGRFLMSINNNDVAELLNSLKADVILAKIDPALHSYRERVCMTSDGNIAGFRRHYSDSVQLSEVTDRWPHRVFLAKQSLGKIVAESSIPSDFSEFLNLCRSADLTVQSIKLGGEVKDLTSEDGLLNVLLNWLESTDEEKFNKSKEGCLSLEKKANCQISDGARLFGRVLLGSNVQIGKGAIIAGPCVLCDNVKIAEGAIVRSAVIGPDTKVGSNQIIQNRIVRTKNDLQASDAEGGQAMPAQTSYSARSNTKENIFRVWPKWSYPGVIKRVADVIFALIILILFAPFFPIIAIAIKINSPGPVFYGARRQGRYGKEFSCLKFRSMMTAAESMQEKLRIINQVDGPQFKMEDDPRITIVGRFLRETFIDEIPQFINVLAGQMSVVGPRPSPESENMLCPAWREARLSVRPGITGMWQVCRTRQPGMDFQEWIHYDTEYIKNLTLRMDLRICWLTTCKFATSFIDQF